MTRILMGKEGPFLCKISRAQEFALGYLDPLPTEDLEKLSLARALAQ